MFLGIHTLFAMFFLKIILKKRLNCFNRFFALASARGMLSLQLCLVLNVYIHLREREGDTDFR